MSDTLDRTPSIDGDGPVWMPAMLGSQLSDGRMRCDLCPHACELAVGETGQCAVRRNDGGILVTSSFAVSVTHVDAIERKPFYHAWPGRRVLTIAAPGCTFRCDYCLNGALSQFGRLPAVAWRGKPANVQALLDRAVVEDADIAFSYTEPALMIELTLALAAQRPDRRPRLFWKTNGFITAAAADLVAPVLAAVNVDVKTADNDAHIRLTGAPLDPVFATIDRLVHAGVWVEVSTPLIPTMTDTPQAWRSIADRIAAIDPAIPWHLGRFTPDLRMAGFPPSSPDSLRAAREAGLASGLRHVYVERALGAQARETRCSYCDHVLVRRGIWCTEAVEFTGDACPGCGNRVPGRWS